MLHELRLATPAHAAGCLAIYRPFVESSHTTFETEAPTEEEFARRIETYSRTHPWIVAADGDRVIGYAYASPFNNRAAYQWTAEVSVYIAPDARGRGLGRVLYTALLRCLRRQGCLNAAALIAQPNEASVALHESMGFRRVAYLPSPGFKLGRWHDVGWWWLTLGPPPESPAPLRPLRDCRADAEQWIREGDDARP
jgi:phosphinothricin acetyltransferase